MMIMIMNIIKNNTLRDGGDASWDISKDHLCLKNHIPARSAGEVQRASAEQAWGLQWELKGTQENRCG